MVERGVRLSLFVFDCLAAPCRQPYNGSQRVLTVRINLEANPEIKDLFFALG